MSDQTKSYVELASSTYNLFVDAVASANQRALRYGKSVYEILARPYPITLGEGAYRDGFDRANQLVELTVRELQAAGQSAAEFGRDVIGQTARWQETYLHAIRGLMQTGVSNLNYVKDATDQQFNGFAQRVEDMAARAERAANPSQN
jgi:hypothetical protein